MENRTLAGTASASPSLLNFLESNSRLTGLVREIYIARGWIKKTRTKEYQVTVKGSKQLSRR